MWAATCVGILALKFKDDLPEAQNNPLQDDEATPG